MKIVLYIVFIPLLLIEWFIDMAVEVVKVIHKSVESLTLVIQNKINVLNSEAANRVKPGRK